MTELEQRSANGSMLRDGASPDDQVILSMVMEEIVQIMRGRGAILSLHDRGAYPVAVHYRSPAIGGKVYDAVVKDCTAAATALNNDEIKWLSTEGAVRVMIIPVACVPGHSRLRIAIVFDQLDDSVHEHAERVYRERRPFAVGFFRFWQLNRLHMRRYQALQAALDCTDIGVLLVDRVGQILFANQAADDILAEGDGLSKHGGALHATNLRDGVNLSAALSYISGGESPGTRKGPAKSPLLAFRRRQGQSLVATIIPARSGAIEARDVAATIYLVDPQLNLAKNLGPICQLFGLSPVETKLVCHLAAGDAIVDVAAKMRIKEQTARSYLKQIFIKTNTNRQTALVALMLSSLMRMKSDVVPEPLTEIGADVALAHCS